MQRGAIGQHQRRAGVEIHARRQRHRLCRFGQAFLGEAAGAGQGDDAVAGFQCLTSAPTALIMPEISAPGVKGSGGLTW
jgi:hypothetical protein